MRRTQAPLRSSTSSPSPSLLTRWRDGTRASAPAALAQTPPGDARTRAPGGVARGGGVLASGAPAAPSDPRGRRIASSASSPCSSNTLRSASASASPLRHAQSVAPPSAPSAHAAAAAAGLHGTGRADPAEGAAGAPLLLVCALQKTLVVGSTQLRIRHPGRVGGRFLGANRKMMRWKKLWVDDGASSFN